MADPKTVTIVDTDFKSGFRIINESDFDASIHKVFDPTGRPAAKAKVLAAEGSETKPATADQAKHEAGGELAPAPRRRAAS